MIRKSVLALSALLIGTAMLTACGAPTTSTTSSSTAAEVPASAPVQKQEEPEPTVSKEQKKALKAAQNYIDTMYFSKRGLYNQLTSEYGNKFDAESAQYAVDNVKVDWNKEALEAAKNYEDMMSMSSQEIYDQLVSEYGEKFEPAQAQYAVDNL